MDQHPVSGTGWLVVTVEQTDVYVPPHPRDVHLREPIRLVYDLKNLTWNRQTHGDALLRRTCAPFPDSSEAITGR
jgi:hypothetical protein